MATEILTPTQTARAIFDTINAKDLDALVRFVDAVTVDDFVAVGEFHGPEEIRRFFAELFTAFPDFTITVERVVGDDTAAVVQWRAGGSFTGGPFQGVEPTGSDVALRGVDVMEITNGIVRRNTIYYDGAAFARQVGMLPRSGSAVDKAVLATFNAVTRARKRISSRR